MSWIVHDGYGMEEIHDLLARCFVLNQERDICDIEFFVAPPHWLHERFGSYRHYCRSVHHPYTHG